jgi:hypothetical protein
MFFLATVIAKFLDARSFILSLTALYFAKKLFHAFFIGGVIAILIETILAAIQVSRYRGEGVIPGVIASTIHASMEFLVFRLVRRRKYQKEFDVFIENNGK